MGHVYKLVEHRREYFLREFTVGTSAWMHPHCMYFIVDSGPEGTWQVNSLSGWLRAYVNSSTLAECFRYVGNLETGYVSMAVRPDEMLAFCDFVLRTGRVIEARVAWDWLRSNYPDYTGNHSYTGNRSVIARNTYDALEVRFIEDEAIRLQIESERTNA